MRIKQLFPELPRQPKGKKERVASNSGNGEQIPKTPVLSAQKPRRMSDILKSPYLKFHSSPPTTKSRSQKKLPSVAEEEETAFNRQMALLEEPPEWDLDAGIGSRDFETSSLTPPAITTSRASSPSRIEKVTENSKKQFQKLTSRLQYSQDPPAGEDGERLSKSEPDLSQLVGKGHAGNISTKNQETRGRSRSTSEQERARSRSGPPSWRMPPKNIRKNMPHVREASPLPSFPIGPVDLKYHESSVMARAMWKNGEVRYEDQWGRRLVQIGRHNSFMFELWPVSEIIEEETPQVEKTDYFSRSK